jgi:hypothetical protein
MQVANWMNKDWRYVPAEKQAEQGILAKWLAQQIQQKDEKK